MLMLVAPMLRAMMEVQSSAENSRLPMDEPVTCTIVSPSIGCGSEIASAMASTVGPHETQIVSPGFTIRSINRAPPVPSAFRRASVVIDFSDGMTSASVSPNRVANLRAICVRVAISGFIRMRTTPLCLASCR